jgi:hypothetical protein
MAKKSTTFKGQPKPYGKSGHFHEPVRHSLQAKGIKTGNLSRPVPFYKPQTGREITQRFVVYKFDDLSKEAKEKAIEKHREFLSEVWDGDYVQDDFKEDMKKWGIDEIEIQYSGFWSQGDGASFTGWIDIPKFLKEAGWEKDYAKLLKAINDGEDIDDVAKIERISHHYSHANTVQVKPLYYRGEDEEVDKQADKLGDEMTDFVREKSRELYRKLEQSYEYETSDENVAESIRINEYEFTADGKLHG